MNIIWPVHVIWPHYKTAYWKVGYALLWLLFHTIIQLDRNILTFFVMKKHDWWLARWTLFKVQYQHIRLDTRRRRYTSFHFQNEVEMDDVNASHLGPSNSTQQLTMAGATYMDLQNRTHQAQSPSPTAEYAPLNPHTRSWEVAKNNVVVEKIIGKGAFGQVAKGTAMELPFRPGETTVAIKMLKGNTFLNWFELFSCIGKKSSLHEHKRDMFHPYLILNIFV